jgi:hypothetical protein
VPLIIDALKRDEARPDTRTREKVGIVFDHIRSALTT